MIIKKGYRITTTSSENDGDYPRTIVKEGLSLEEVKFIGDLVTLMWDPGTGIENEYEPIRAQLEDAHEAFLVVIERHAAMFTEGELALYRKSVGFILGYIRKMLTGHPAEGYDLRSVDDFQVHYVPEDIFFDDVTALFVSEPHD